MKTRGLKLWMVLLIAIIAFVVVFLCVRFIPSASNALQRRVNGNTIYVDVKAEDLVDEDGKYTILDYPFDVDLNEYMTMDDYDDLVVEEVEIPEATDEAIDDVVENYIDQNDKYEKQTNGIVEVGDIIDVSYKAYSDDVEVTDLSTENHVYTFGEGGEPDDFIEALSGADVGKELEFSVTFPEDDEDYPSRTFDFVAIVNSINIIPDVTDENIEDITDGDYSSVDDFREYLKEGLEEYNEETYEETLIDEISESLLDIENIDEIPQELANWYVSFGMASVQLTADDEDVGFDDVVLEMGYDSTQDLVDNFAADCADGLAETMAVMWVANYEGISFDETEDSVYYENRITELMSNLGIRTEEKALTYYKDSNVRRDVVEWKTWEFLIDNVKQE